MNASRTGLGFAAGVVLSGFHTNAALGPRELPPLWERCFAAEVARIEARSPETITSAARWAERAPVLREELRDMLGLDPWPERTPLHAVTTGVTEHDEFRVERLHFQSRPGLYVTGNLYLPREQAGPAPAILYVCGHGAVKIDGVSYGNKVSYQHHGAWFARHGYVCLLIDTVQLGELEGVHHGTYREGMWWWNSRGYTPAGVEAWNSIRAIDYLQSRPEVDGERIGMTGRSGGGAYTWWTAAIDGRVKVAVPVAGITDLHNHVLDGAVEGHCDCMFMVNTRRWDFAQVAALLAPRPLLIANTDRDPIFPLDGVLRVHRDVAALYRALDAEDKLGLLITEGPHKDTQDLQVPTFRWFNRFLKEEDPLIAAPAGKFFTPQQLKVFADLPSDEVTTRAHEHFVPAAEFAVPSSHVEWRAFGVSVRERLRATTFAGWPDEKPALLREEQTVRGAGDVRVHRWQLEVQPGLSLPLVLLEPRRPVSRQVRLVVLGHAGWQQFAADAAERFGITDFASPVADSGEQPTQIDNWRLPEVIEQPLAVFAPRAAGVTAPGFNERGFVHFRRRFMLIGQTLDGIRVWDIRRAIAALEGRNPDDPHGLVLEAAGDMAVNAVYAALFEPRVTALGLSNLPASHRAGPDYLGVLRVVDLPVALALAAEGKDLHVDGTPTAATAVWQQVNNRWPSAEGATGQ